MNEKPPPNRINCHSLRRLRERQFILLAAEDARPSAQASLRLRPRLVAHRPTGKPDAPASASPERLDSRATQPACSQPICCPQRRLSIIMKIRVNQNISLLADTRKSLITGGKRTIRKRSFGKIAAMTELERPIKRRSRMPFGHYRKRMVVMLHPGDKIAMRLEKSRTWYWAELDDVFRVLAQWHAARERQRIRGTEGSKRPVKC